MPYMTACDLDDTLLTKNKKITWKSKRFIRKYVKRGNYFIICTGRPFAGAKKYYDSLKIKMPFICDNGASIYFPHLNKTKFFDIPLKTFQRFLREIDDCIYSAISTSNNVISIQNRSGVPDWIIHTEIEGIKIEEGKLIDILKFNPLLPNFWIHKDKIDKFNEVAQKYQDCLAFRNWGLHNDLWSIEMFSVEASKGKTLLYLADYYQIPHENTCSFGDQWNDLSMIDAAGYGVAMINGQEELKKATKYCSLKDNNHNGVIHFIKVNKLY